MSKPKVMHILRMGEYSGAENVAITLIKSVQDEFDCVYVSPDGPIKQIVSENGITHYALDVFNAKSIRKAIDELHPALIHAHDFMASEVCAAVAGKIPVVAHLHNNAPWLSKIGIKSFSFIPACLRAKAILTVSDSVMNEYIFGKSFRKKTHVIGNPVCGEAIRRKADLAEVTDPSDVIFLGRLAPEKNPLLFIDIVQELKKAFPLLKAAMVGEGILRADIEKKIRETGLSENITLYGFLDNPHGLLKSSRVMCMPSVWEGFGLAAAEALALGKPVAASAVGGLPKIVTPDCGALCGAIDEYTRSIKLLLEDEQLYRKRSQSALIQAQKLDNLAEYRQKICAVYNTCL